MATLFNAFKKYIIKHPLVQAYKPSSDKYDADKLIEILKKLPCDKISESDLKVILDFKKVSGLLHNLYAVTYQMLNQQLPYFNMKGKNIAEYMAAALNQEYKIIHDRRQKNFVVC